MVMEYHITFVVMEKSGNFICTNSRNVVISSIHWHCWLSNRKGIWLVNNLYYLSPKVLRGNQLTSVHLVSSHNIERWYYVTFCRITATIHTVFGRIIINSRWQLGAILGTFSIYFCRLTVLPIFTSFTARICILCNVLHFVNYIINLCDDDGMIIE